MPIAKIKHACKEHPFQDKAYGKDKRVFTTFGQKNKIGKSGLRCTVCGKEQDH